MKNSPDFVNLLQINTEEINNTNPLTLGAEKLSSGISGVNRFIEDLRGKPKPGTRIDVQIDWAQGRMAISY
jgi:hypothetical protein